MTRLVIQDDKMNTDRGFALEYFFSILSNSYSCYKLVNLEKKFNKIWICKKKQLTLLNQLCSRYKIKKKNKKYIC